VKNLEEIKKSMITYVESDISELSEQTDEKEGMAFLNRIRGQLGMISLSGIINQDETSVLHDKLAKAREKAEKNILNSNKI
jgi:hypothetical protein